MVAKMTDMEDRKIHIAVNGMTYFFELSQCTEDELKKLKALLLWTLQYLIEPRGLFYGAIAKINGELDRRTNDAAAITHMK